MIVRIVRSAVMKCLKMKHTAKSAVVNERGKDFSKEFTLPYQRHRSKDNFDILRNFYIQFKKLFS